MRQQVVRIRLDSEIGEKHYLTPISDAHIDAANCDLGAFRRLLRERASIKNHRFISLGDLGSFILPCDRKRFLPSATAHAAVAGRDDWVNSICEYIYSELKSYKFDMLGYGNHEAVLSKHGSVDVVSTLAEKMGAQIGDYSGYLVYDIFFPGKRNTNFSILYHHGKWCGDSSKGFPGFHRWAQHYRGWDIALSGHNHFLWSDVVGFGALADGRPQKISMQQCRLVVCGSHQSGIIDDGRGAPQYGQIAGHVPTPIGAPLITFWAERHATRGAGSEISMQCRVEI